MAKPVVKQKSHKKNIVLAVYILVLIAAIVFGAFFFVRYNQVNAKYKTAIMTDEQKNQQYVVKVAKLYSIPKYEDEKPDVAVISDTSKLADSVVAKKFFGGAKEGDVIMVYKNADLSIIYRPSEDKIVRTDNYANALAATNTYKVAVIAPADQQEAIVQKLQSTFGNVSIVNKQTPKAEAAQSYVADTTGTNTKAAQELAEKLGLQVGQLAEGETKPEGAALIVVIAGQPAVPAQ